MKNRITLKRAAAFLASAVVIHVASVYSCSVFYSWMTGNDETEMGLHLLKTDSPIFIPSVFLSTLFILVTAVLMLKKPVGYETVSTDSRGIAFLNSGTRGTARWMSRKEAEKIFTVGRIEDTDQTVFGQFDHQGRQTVSYRNLARGNRHFVVLGNSGAGKSHTFVRTELIQSVKRGDSFVTTDASGELYVSLAGYCRQKGYRVKVLNLHYPRHSVGWNCVREIIDPETERLDETRLTNFVSIFMNNTKSGKEDTFWYEGETNLLKAVLGWIAYRRETEIIQGLKRLAKSSLDPEEKNNRLMKNCGFGEDENNCSSIREMKSRVLNVLSEKGHSEKEIAEKIKRIEDDARPLSISEALKTVLNDAADCSRWEKSFSDIPFAHPASIAFSIFSNSTVREDIRNGLSIRMGIFSDTALRRALSADDIVLEDFNREKTACFVIFNNKVNSMRPVMSLFFGFLFNDCSAAYERDSLQESVKGQINKRCAISVVMDEFYSIGYIDGFINFITNSRKSNINISIILQYSRQLYELYGENDGTGIMSSCEVAVLLNCNDRETAEYFSSFMTGTSTVRGVSNRSQDSLLGLSGGRSDISVTEQSRSLMTLDEFRTMPQDKCLVIRRGSHPLLVNTFPYTEHPAYKAGELKESSPFDIDCLSAYKDRSFGSRTFMEMKKGVSKVREEVPKKYAQLLDDLPDQRENEKKTKTGRRNKSETDKRNSLY